MANQKESTSEAQDMRVTREEDGNDIHIQLRLEPSQRVHINFESEPHGHKKAKAAPTPEKIRTPKPEKERKAALFLSQQWGKVKTAWQKLITPSQAAEGSRRYNKLAMVLFILGLVVYLLTRFIKLPDFPIYFFTDEAVQGQLAADFVRDGFENYAGFFLPTYFDNSGKYSLGFSVYAQVLPYLIFGKSVWATRGVSVLLSLVAAIGSGLILRDALKNHYWWLGPILLAAVPGWFLHSRTAFETVIMASMYIGFLYFYLRYRQGKTKSLYIALVFGALSFYSYNPGQMITVVTGLMLLIADARYHWQHRKTTLIGLGLLTALALPYLRFSLTQGDERIRHLTLLSSYWIKPIPWYEKIGTYFVRYLKGLNPFYWFWPTPSIIEKWWPNYHMPIWLFSNTTDLTRHIMKGYGHILLLTLPFWAIGVIRCIRKFRKPAYRTLLLATLAAPTGAAMVDWGITRGLVFIIPTTIITAVGIEAALKWLRKKWPKLTYPLIAGSLFLVLTLVSFWMLGDALKNAPIWYEDYGLSGLQYGGQVVFTRAAEIARENPETTIYVSSTWANAPNVIMRYFTDDLPNVRMGNINAFGLAYQPITEAMLFVLTPDDLHWVNESGKFEDITIEETILYPNNEDGFYFVRLAYVDNIEMVLAEEREARQTLKETPLEINGQPVSVQFPTLDINEVKHAFDGDTSTLIRTLETNPLRLILTYPDPVDIEQVTLWIGGAPTTMTITAKSETGEAVTIEKTVEGSAVVRDEILRFDETIRTKTLTIEVLNKNDGEVAHVHLWEVDIK
jgi:hypothetical protein